MRLQSADSIGAESVFHARANRLMGMVLAGLTLAAMPSLGATEPAALFQVLGPVDPPSERSAAFIDAPITAWRSLEQPANLRHVSVDVALLESARDAILSGRDTSMRINPSDGTEFVAVLERMEPTLHGFSLSGTIADDPSSTAVLVVNGHVVAGVFNTGFRTWTLLHGTTNG